MNVAAKGEAGTWLVAGAAAACLAAMLALLAWLTLAGFAALWPSRIVEIRLDDGRKTLGEIVAASDEALAIRTSERDRIGGGYVRLLRSTIASTSEPDDAFVVALADGRRLYGRGDASVAAAAQREAGSPDAEETVWPNALGFFGRAGLFVRHAGRFLATSTPAPALVGGVLPALIGTVTLVAQKRPA